MSRTAPPTQSLRALTLLCLLVGCAKSLEQRRPGEDASRTGPAQTASQGASVCPERTAAPSWLPGSSAERTSLTHWLSRYGASELDRPLLSVEAVAQYNRTRGRLPGRQPHSQRDLAVAVRQGDLADDVRGRLAYLREKLKDGSLKPDNGALSESQQQAMASSLPSPLPDRELRVALAALPLRCGPYPGPLYKGEPDPAYDRNACSTIRAQEVVELLTPWQGGMALARTRYALGWLDSDAALSPALGPGDREAFLSGPRARMGTGHTLTPHNGGAVALPAHTSLPLDPHDGTLRLASAEGFQQAPRPDGVQPTRRPLTRRALLTTAFEFLDAPYGLGGAAGGRDCSRTLLDIFESFDLALPRHSGWQAQAGSYHLELADLSEADKLQRIDLANRNGIVLLHFPGHIMLYVGRSDDGRAMALHALGEYAAPCEGGGETVFDVRRTVVTDLEVGRGSSRRAFVERLTRAVVIGGEPGNELGAHASRPLQPPALPPADASCRDSLEHRLFVSPRRPVDDQELRVIAASDTDPQGARLWLFDPSGQTAALQPKQLGGPPHGQWLARGRPKSGRWTALLARGQEVIACKRFGVRSARIRRETPMDQAIWESRWSWEQDTHNFWALFVEQLFDYPVEDGRTWTNLHDLLRDRERNLLYGHLGHGEEAKLELVPDCADLPYTLRAYFAWKLKLPFAFRRCARGRVGQPPSCGAPNTNQEPRQANDDVEAFHLFVNRRVRSGVHSASGRTHPKSEETDLYPTALTRRALTPGTVYADPYGHVMMLTKWFPQQQDRYGILMAAEAQPDGTVGRRRFWRGSFLFDPSTADVGAGFKHFRPLVMDRQSKSLTALDNATLARDSQHPPYAMDQYRGTRDDFYDRMDALINPDPLDPSQRLLSLVDAFEESVRRRVTAVSNGEQFMQQRRYAAIEMPVGHKIFETSGPWEDFSTPSRDMRLLISMDTVTGFAEKVERQPERFGFSAQNVEASVASLRQELERTLAARSFEYQRSDGVQQTLTLTELVNRASALELAYNPNDCVELRWGAAQSSPEAAGCARRAPKPQQQRMDRYRPWFHTRTRPPRGARQP